MRATSVSDTMRLERELWDQGLCRIAGMDEAGRGPLAGPVVAAAVVFPQEVSIPGVRDSKRLTARQRELLYSRISEEALSVGIGVVGNELIDALNIRMATLEAMRIAMENLGIRPEFALVDGDVFTHDAIPVRNVINGDDQSFTIGAASIIAKVTRDRLMLKYHRRFPLYNFAKHKGYGTREHVEAIRRFGLCAIHRRSFRVTGWRKER